MGLGVTHFLMSPKLLPPYENKTPASTPGCASSLRRTVWVRGPGSRPPRRAARRPPGSPGRTAELGADVARLRTRTVTRASGPAVGEDALKSRPGAAEGKAFRSRAYCALPRARFTSGRTPGPPSWSSGGKYTSSHNAGPFLFRILNGLKQLSKFNDT